MKRFLILALALTMMSLVSCSMDSTQPLSDPRFNGYFVYSNYVKYNDYVNYSYTFDGTDECTYYYNYKYYDKVTGWHNEKGLDYVKIEINESKTHFRFCDYDWREWKRYEFLDNGNLRIWDFPDKYPSSYNDYVKM